MLKIKKHWSDDFESSDQVAKFHQMNILLLGATGRTGKHILKYALEAGHKVNALIRYPDKVESNSDNLTVFEGNAINKEELKVALENCDVLISALNISRTSDFPWAKLRTPKTYLSDVIKNVIEAADPEKLKRIVVCSAWGVAETRDHIPGWFRWFIENSNIGVAYTDHERQEKLLEDSAFNYTLVRPVGLTNFGLSEVQETFEYEPKPSILISRKSVADFMVKAVDDKRLLNRKIVVSKK